MESPDPVVFPAYCINLPKSTLRRERMVKRFERAGFMSKDVHFVDAADQNSGLVDYYTRDAKPWFSDVGQYRRDVACFASHLLAVRAFLASGADYGFICEDDILFINGFKDKVQTIFAALPDGFPLVSLSYMATHAFDLKSANSNLFCKYPTGIVWGAQCYLISKQYAMDVLDDFDQPLRFLTEHGSLSSEIILHQSDGYMTTKPLVIEDCLSSVRKLGYGDIPWHIKHYCCWEWSNFSDSDLERDSPLVNINKDKCWQVYFELFPELFPDTPKRLTKAEIQTQLREFGTLVKE